MNWGGFDEHTELSSPHLAPFQLGWNNGDIFVPATKETLFLFFHSFCTLSQFCPHPPQSVPFIFISCVVVISVLILFVTGKMLHWINDIIASPKRQMGKIPHFLHAMDVFACVVNWTTKCEYIWIEYQNKKGIGYSRSYTLHNNCCEVIECIDSSVNNSFLYCSIFRILHQWSTEAVLMPSKELNSQPNTHIRCGKKESQKIKQHRELNSTQQTKRWKNKKRTANKTKPNKNETQKTAAILL